MRHVWLMFFLSGAVLAPSVASADAIDLSLSLKKWYGRGKFLLKIPKFQTNYQDCLARGGSQEQCQSLVTYCALQEQPFIGLGYYVKLYKAVGLLQTFKRDCGSMECFQCCYVPVQEDGSGGGCHTSFVGFPVINCNPRYGVGTRDAGLTLITDPNAMPGDACLTTPQTCEHIPVCAGDPAAVRERLDGGEDHPLGHENAPANRGKWFARRMYEKWCGYLNRFHTGEPRDPEMPGFETVEDLRNFVTGRGCVGWRANVGEIWPIDWANDFAVMDEEGMVLEGPTHLNGLCQTGFVRALSAVPNLYERLSFVESTVWPEPLLNMYVAMVGDPDEELLHHADPIVRDLLACNPGVSDYRLLGVPLEDEEDSERVFNGCDLGRAPRVFLDAIPQGGNVLQIRVEVRDPEVGTEHEAPIPLTIFWGDGRVSLEELPAGQGEGMFQHAYAAPGDYAVFVMGENTSGLRGFGAVIGAVEAGGEAEGPVVVNEVRFIDAIARANTLTGNARTLWLELEGHDPTDDSLQQIGIGPDRQINFNEDIALGTLIARNTGAAPLDRIVIRPHWRAGFYTGFRGAFLRAERVELHVFSTNTQETVPIELPLTPDVVRVYVRGQEEPIPGDQLTIDEMGRMQLFLHDRDRLADRIEIDLPQDLLAANAPGPLAEPDNELVSESWFEDRPNLFIPVGRDPDAGPPPEPDMGPDAALDPDDGVLPPDAGMGAGGEGGAGGAGGGGEGGEGGEGGAPARDGGPGVDEGVGGDDGGGGGCSSTNAPSAWWLLCLPLVLRRRL